MTTAPTKEPGRCPACGHAWDDHPRRVHLKETRCIGLDAGGVTCRCTRMQPGARRKWQPA